MQVPPCGRVPAGPGQVHPRALRRRAGAAVLGLFLCVSAISGRVALAQPRLPGSATDTEVSAAVPTMASAASLQDEIARKREALKAEFATLRRKLEAAAQSETYADRDSLLQEVDALRQLERLYGQQAALAQIRGETAAEQARLEETLRQLHTSGVAGERPFSFFLLDRREDDLDAETGRLATLDAGVEFAAEARDQAKQTLEAAERARRAAQEALDTNHDAARVAELETRARLTKLASQVATEEGLLRELEFANEKLNRDVRRTSTTLLREEVDLISREVQLTDKELREQIVKLETDEVDVTQALDTVRQRMMAAEPTGAAGDAEAARAQRQTLQLRFAVLSQRLQQLAQLKQLWSRRYSLASGTVSRDDLPEWEREVRRQVEQVDREERLYTARLVELRRSTQSPDEAPQAEGTRSPVAQQEIEARIAVYENALANLEGFRRAQERLLRQIEALTQHEAFADRLRQGWHVVDAAWRYEILAVQDRPITIGKIVLGILLFIAGLYVSTFSSRFLGRRVWPRLGLDPGASAALQSLSYYVLVVLMTLFALEAVNVPLTLFTFVGGALAIGVGFGSQNVVNNFISGLILLAERPIKVGDLVELGDMRGTVESIGARSTSVRSHKNIHVIVPNSHFLEKEVVNWTLADDSVKASVCVGAAYGSAVDAVRDALVEAVSHHEKIFTTPAPTVLLRNFGDNALEFEVFFWVRIRSSMEMWIIESEVRFRIEQLFRDHDIVIAFPQRDVRLETKGPVAVRLLRE